MTNKILLVYMLYINMYSLSCILFSKSHIYFYHFQPSCGNKKPIIHVDSFLFEEEHIDALEAEGKLERYYCEKCGSLNVAPISKYFF